MSETVAGLSIPQEAPACASNDTPTLELFSMKGKVASITGSSTGIGFAVAEAYAQAGADVCIWYNSHNPEEKAKGLASKYGVKVKTYQVQVTDSDAVEKAIKQQVADFGKIDVFIANAGVPWQKGAMIEQPDHEEWNRVVQLDLNGAYYCSKFAGQVFKKQGFGSFIFTASMSGTIVNVPQLQACYNAVKAALIHLAKSLAVEWAGFARCNCVSPGYTATEISDFVPKDIQAKWNALTPMGRAGQPKEMCGAYLYLGSDASTFTTGLNLIVDGGYSLQ